MPAAVGYTPQRAARIDRDSILLGSVSAGVNGDGDLEAAATRTGAARLLEGRLNPYDNWKVVAVGGQSSSAGGYLVQAAHVAQGDALANASAWATIGAIAFSGTAEIPLGFTGDQSEALVRAAAVAAGAAITGKVRVTALRLRPGTGNLSISNIALTSNVVTVTLSAAHTMLPGEVVTVVCSNTAVNGTFPVKTTPLATTFTYDLTASNITSASATGTVSNGVAVPSGTGNRIHLQRT
jgi:hypothetical protein